MITKTDLLQFDKQNNYPVRMFLD